MPKELPKKLDFLTKLNAEIVVKGIELKTLIKLRTELTRPEPPAVKLPVKKQNKK